MSAKDYKIRIGRQDAFIASNEIGDFELIDDVQMTRLLTWYVLKRKADNLLIKLLDSDIKISVSVNDSEISNLSSEEYEKLIAELRD